MCFNAFETLDCVSCSIELIYSSALNTADDDSESFVITTNTVGIVIGMHVWLINLSTLTKTYNATF